jgi:hydrogenase nickel incorporation protein HypA/HybF
MHEWALAEGVISTALRVAEDKNAEEIVKVKVRIGELQQIDKDIFETALGELVKNTIAAKTRTEIETEKSVLKCRVCGNEWTFDHSKKELGEEEFEAIHFLPDIASVYIRCPKCSSPDFKIKGGRGVWIDSIEIKR